MIVSLVRKTQRPYRFCDGTFLPEGSIIAATQSATHADPEYFDNPDEFDGFRWSSARYKGEGNTDEPELPEEMEDDEWQHRLTSTGTNYLAFGGGRHVW